MSLARAAGPRRAAAAPVVRRGAAALAAAGLAALLRVLALAAALAALAAPATSTAWAQQDPGGGERILSFDSRIEVEDDGDIVVSETIAVVARGSRIRRGIFRDLPLDRAAGYGRTVSDLDILEVERDGEAEPYGTERDGPRVRITIGDKDVFLSSGVHTYVIRYRLDQQIGFFPDYDEIYWNATGDEWAFTIEAATATVVLPAGTPVLSTAVYTGRAGSTDHDATVAQDGREVTFTATAPLAPGEGMTVAVGFPKGILSEPSAASLALRELMPAIVAGLGLIAVLLYYLWAWRRVGVDPEAGPLIPVYAPTLPPAAMRYLERGYDATGLTAALLEAATKGGLLIEEPAEGSTVLRRRDGGRPPSAETAAALATIFAGGDSLTLAGAGNVTLAKGGEALRKGLSGAYGATHRRGNYLWFAIGLALTVVVWLAAAQFAPYADEAIVAPLVALFATVFVYGFGSAALAAWRGAFAGRLLDVPKALIFSVFLLAAFLFWAGAVGIYLAFVGLAAAVILVASAAISVVFFRLLPAPTVLGRKALDEIAGTRLYLTVAEADRLKFHHPPDRTPAHFEAMLPYAVALGVEAAWAEQFRDVLAAAAGPAAAATAMQPSWYAGPRRAGDIGGLSSGVSRSITNSVAQGMAAIAAAQARASGRGGSSGGGSSGGGGGGGGGGGW